MPIEIRTLLIRANVEAQRDNSTGNSNRRIDNDVKANQQLDILMKLKKMIEQKNER